MPKNVVYIYKNYLYSKKKDCYWCYKMRICPLINGECKKRDCEFWRRDYNECVVKYIPMVWYRLKEIEEMLSNTSKLIKNYLREFK